MIRALALGLLIVATTAAIAHADDLRQVRAVLHVHTDFTTGELTLDEIVARARSQRIEAIFFAENYLLRVEYGLPPFRSLLRVAREEPSVLARGVEQYLERVAAARQQHPDLVLVPGVEIIPHYRWTGSPFDGEFTVHNLQKNILVFGLTTPAAIRALPATGSPTTTAYSVASLPDLAPVALIVPGLWFLLRPGVSRRRIAHGVVVVRPRRRWVGGLLALIGLLALVRGYPFTIDLDSPYRDFGVTPYQDLIDVAEGLGGAAVWSFPDAFDYGEQRILGLRVTRRTEPYGDDLLRTFRYSAFGGVYEDTTRFPQLGGGWDYLLGQYARGERSRPAWLVGESGFHDDHDGKWIGAAETVFLVPAKSEAALVDALKNGRAYGVLRTDRNASPVLDRFAVATSAGAGIAGDTVRLLAGTPVEVQVGVQMSDGGGKPVRVTLIKNGGVLRIWTGTTPLALAHQEAFDGAPAYYRLDVRGPGSSYMLSNPIFLRPAKPATSS